MNFQANAITKTYGTHRVLSGLNLSLNAGQLTCLLGQNGAGKTTLLRILAGLQKPNQGQVLLDGHTAAESEAFRRQIGAVMHQTYLYEYLSALENLRFYAQLYEVPAETPFLKEALARVGLGKVRQTPVRTFSRGMKQRLTLARALIANPKLLLFDEPYTGLDLSGCQLLNELLLEEKARGRIILATTHEFAFIRQIADRFVILSEGRIVDDFSGGPQLGLAQLEARYLAITEPRLHAAPAPRQAQQEAF
ncbi:MAG: heme ABC exporter ATP-binding protein CcmA [Anaerolineaceae bacterium]|nr:heme ABC exporter ATP-binding protein CcmA [Anaerolineaceae bacterium]